MKIVHISDLHFPEHKGTERLIDKIIEHYDLSPEKPVVICSGDILETPPSFQNEENYIKVKNILFKLKENGFKLLICPGNHDLKKGGLSRKKLIRQNLKKFNSYYYDLLPTNMDYHDDQKNDLLSFPIVHQLDNHFFIGLNSMTNQPKSAKGILGSRQLLDLKAEIESIRKNNQNPIITVYLHHNPFPFEINVAGVPDIGDRIVRNKLRLIDRKAFLKIVQGINILVFGHLHWNKRHVKFEEKYNINCIQLTGGSTIKKNQVSWTEIETKTFSSENFSF